MSHFVLKAAKICGSFKCNDPIHVTTSFACKKETTRNWSEPPQEQFRCPSHHKLEAPAGGRGVGKICIIISYVFLYHRMISHVNLQTYTYIYIYISIHIILNNLILSYLFLHTVSNGAAVNLHIFSCGFGRVGQVRKGENMATSKAAHHSTFYLLIFSILLPISNLSSSDRSKGGRS